MLGREEGAKGNMNCREIKYKMAYDLNEVMAQQSKTGNICVIVLEKDIEICGVHFKRNTLNC